MLFGCVFFLNIRHVVKWCSGQEEIPVSSRLTDPVTLIQDQLVIACSEWEIKHVHDLQYLWLNLQQPLCLALRSRMPFCSFLISSLSVFCFFYFNIWFVFWCFILFLFLTLCMVWFRGSRLGIILFASRYLGVTVQSVCRKTTTTSE